MVHPAPDDAQSSMDAPGLAAASDVARQDEDVVAGEPTGDGDGIPGGDGAGRGPGHGSGVGASVGGGGPGSLAALGEYLELVRRRIDQHKRYPAAAQRLGIEGRVLVRLGIRADGHLLSVAVVEADQDLLSTCVRDAVAHAAPFPPVPSSVGRPEVEVLVPLRFRLSDEEDQE